MDLKTDVEILKDQGKWVAKKLDSIEKKLDSLFEFKWKIYSGVVVIAFLISTGVELFWRFSK